MADLQIPEKLLPLLRPKRLKIIYGGRGSAKSWTIAQILTVIGSTKPLRVLCTREFQGSIQDSVHRLLADTIARNGLEWFYEVLQKEIIGKNDTGFLFEGLKNNVTKIKSFEGIDIVWAEEAENIVDFSWDTLIPTIRKAGSEIWVSFNPYDEADDTWQRFIVPYEEILERDGYYEDDDVMIIQMNWRDNPWFYETELPKEMEAMKRNDYQKYLHIWEGKLNTDYGDSIIQPEWVDAAVDAHLKFPDMKRGTRACGFDPADQGSDNKAVALLHGVTATNIVDWADGDLEDAIARAYDYAFEHRASEFVWDSIGIGAGVKMGLKKHTGQDPMRLHPFGGGDMPDDPDKTYRDGRIIKEVFRNKRAQYWWYLRDRFEATYRAVKHNEYRDPQEMISLSSEIKNLSMLKSELCRVQRKRGSNSLIQLESKPEMAKRGAKSPNMADALVMAFAYPPEKVKNRAKIKYPNRGII